MRKLLTILSLTLCFSSQAKNYYFSNSGNDSRTTLEAQSQSTPWMSINKLNSFFSSLVAGDTVFFKKGDTFYGAITPNKNGNAGLPIVISAYGTGAKPIITGLSTMTGWTNVGTNLWQATVPGTNTPNLVIINSNIAGVGRTPNYGWGSIYETHNGNLSITDNQLINFPNHTNAYLNFRSLHDQISHVRINSHVGATVSYDSINGYRPINGASYFFSNALSCVDTANEWYIDQATRLLTVYSIGSPTDVKVATKDTLIAINQWDNITLDGIAIYGANKYCVTAGNTKAGQALNATITNCDISFAGIDGIYMTWDLGSVITGNTISNCLNIGIELENEGGFSNNATVTNNTVRNIGLIPGMGIKYSAITYWGNNGNISFNNIDSVGHTGISGYYDNLKFNNNLINHYCMTVDDAGAINLFDNSFGATTEVNREILNNIILNGASGVGVGTADGGDVVIGIYIDDHSNNVIIKGNSVGTVPRYGIYIHNGTDIVVDSNTVFDAGEAQFSAWADDHAPTQPVRRVSLNSNIFWMNSSTQLAHRTRVLVGKIDTTYSAMDRNIYARPKATTGNTISATVNYKSTNNTTNYTLASFKTAFASSVNGPWETNSLVGAANTLTARMYPNWSNNLLVLNLGDTVKRDVYGNRYTGTATVGRYQSLILVDSGFIANVRPVAYADTNRTITLPTSSTTLNGSATDADGTIASYLWYKASGPATGTITSNSTASTGLTGLVQGIYQFAMIATDNLGLKDTAYVIVTVNAAAPVNVRPTISVQPTDTTITLPNPAGMLRAYGADSDGTISAYAWRQIAGPAVTINSPSAQNTTISGLAPGTVVLQAKATDNSTDTAVANVTIHVLAAPVNIPPVADAGLDRGITLPQDTVHLVGIGTDVDGTISTYAWTVTSGPGGSSFGTSNAASTTFTGLVAGTYVVRLTVTDDDSATGFDELTIVVSPAAPPATGPYLFFNTIVLP